MLHFVNFLKHFLYPLTLPTVLVQFNLCILTPLFQHFSLLAKLTSCLEWEPEDQSAFWGHLGLAPLIRDLSASRVDSSRLTISMTNASCENMWFVQMEKFFPSTGEYIKYLYLWENKVMYAALTKFLLFTSVCRLVFASSEFHWLLSLLKYQLWDMESQQNNLFPAHEKFTQVKTQCLKVNIPILTNTLNVYTCIQLK